jgi:hypothetical protein
MLWEMDKTYGLPVVFVEQLQCAADNVLDNRADCLGLMCGRERRGKSTLETLIARVFADRLHTEIDLKRDYHYDLIDFTDDCRLVTYPDNGNAMYPKKGGKHYVKIYDEPVLGANARKWSSKGNILLNQTFAAIGYKYLVMLAGIPNFFMLDNMVREHRVAFMCLVDSVVDEKTGLIEKGYFSLYNGKAVRKIYRDKETRQIHYPKTKFTDMRFQSLEGTQFWQQYEHYSAQAKNDQIMQLSNDAKNIRNEQLKAAKKLDKEMAKEAGEPDGG